MKKTYIYSLMDPVTMSIRYIGKADNPHRRFVSGHIPESNRRNTKKCTWIKSLKFKNLRPILEIIDHVHDSEWIFWEQHYISLFKSWGFNLTNSTIGGDHGPSVSGMKGKKHTPETIALIKACRW